jgi:23S rRNA (uracil1939-C5)-methyltransferase
MPEPTRGRDQEFEVTPGSFGPRGDAVVRGPDGRIISVPGAIPGERLRVKPMARRRGVIHTRIVEVLEASPDRVSPPCPEVARGCGACQWQHLDLSSQQAHKREIVADALGLAPEDRETILRPTVALPPDGFRTTLHAAVHRGRAGFRRYRSHRVVPVDGCLVAHPSLVELLVDGKFGDATEVLLRCGARTGARLAATEPAGAAIDVPADVGRDHVTESAAGRDWRISARSFFQSRADGVDALAAAVIDATDDLEAGRALDLYSGVGVFAGVLATHGWSVTAVESAASAVADSRVNLRDLDVTTLRADVTQWRPPPSDVVVADPSRAGLEPRGAEVVAASGARRLVLVSCDAASLGRDSALLHAAGYALTAATPIDLFPHTFHVEVVSVFDR